MVSSIFRKQLNDLDSLQAEINEWLTIMEENGYNIYDKNEYIVNNNFMVITIWMIKK